MKVGAMPWPGFISFLIVCLLVLVAARATADELQDRIESAIKAYGDIAPEHPDVFLGRAQILIEDAVRKSNPSEIVTSTQIGDWLARNQPVDEIDPDLRAQLVQWLSLAFRQAMGVNTVYATALPSQAIPVSELQLRISTAVDKVMPGPSKMELVIEAERAAKSLEEAMRETAARRRASQHDMTWRSTRKAPSTRLTQLGPDWVPMEFTKEPAK